MTAPAPRDEGNTQITTLLGQGSEFDGKLTFEGGVRIQGNFRGEIFSEDVLVIGEGAYVEAEIEIGEIIIQGTVVGNIRAKRAIEIHKPGKVKGDLTTPSLQMERGVVFEGRSFMEEMSGQAIERKKPAAQASGTTASTKVAKNGASKDAPAKGKPSK
ncbi:MAG: polymer-forming cytoskeletal protein [Myxococcota bacterium]